MTNETPDPAATFHLDQVAAATEEATRDEMAWAMRIQAHQSEVALREAMAADTNARAGLYTSLGALATSLGVVVLANGTVAAARRLLGRH